LTVDVARTERSGAAHAAGTWAETTGGVAAAAEGGKAPAESIALVAAQPVGKPTLLFHGKPDEELLGPLREAPLKAIRLKGGGLTLSFKLELENGAEAAYKPNQSGKTGGQKPRYEIAAFRINRLLGLASVPPAIGRSFPLATVRNARGGSDEHRLRLQTELISDGNGMVAGELSWWIPIIQPARIEGQKIDKPPGEAIWSRYLTIGVDIPETARSMVAQISNMVLFDLVIDNSDRWAGGNTKMSEDSTFLYFMDNTLAFGRNKRGHPRLWSQLRKVQKFSASLVARMRLLGENEVRSALGEDRGPFPELLKEEEIQALFSRRDHVLAYIDELIAKHGEKAVLAFP
jgi:hypothetical protein